MTDKPAGLRTGQGDPQSQASCQPHALDHESTRPSSLAEDAVMAVAVTLPIAVVCIALVLWLQ